MQARYEFVEKLKGEVQNRLRQVVGNQGIYRDLTRQLIVQVKGLAHRECSE
jgi:hypothetical protein